MTLVKHILEITRSHQWYEVCFSLSNKLFYMLGRWILLALAGVAPPDQEDVDHDINLAMLLGACPVW